MMQSVEQGGVGVSSGGDLDLRALGAALWRKKWLILLPTLLVAAAALAVVNQITPRFQSEAKIMVEGRENVFLRPEAEKSIDRAAADQEAIATQVQVIQSRDIARQVIRELKLGERPEFDPVLKGVSPVTGILSIFGIGRDRLNMTAEERVMEVYYQRLTVSAVERSRVITIQFQSEDPELAANVVNAILDAYMKVQQQAKVEQTRSAVAYLANEIEQLRKTVQESDAKVDAFRAKANLFVGANQTNLSTQQLGELTTQLANARAQKADLEARSQAIRTMLKGGKPVESSDIFNSDLLKRLVEQRVLLRAQLAEQSSTLLDRHPRIQELNAQIRSLDVQIHVELERLVLAMENDARIASLRVDQTVDAIDRIKRQISGASPQEVQLRALEREAKAQRDLLESYLARYREATARENLDAPPAEVRVISRATVSNVPAFPKTLPIVIVAALATLFLVTAFVLSGEILRQGVPNVMRRDQALAESPERASPAAPSAARRSLFGLFRKSSGMTSEGQQANPLAPVAPLPTTAAAPPAAAKADRLSTLANALSTMGESGRRVVIFGAERNVGATYTALVLARALAAKGGRVILADLALNAPNLSIMSVDPNAPGFAELVRGTASFGDIITRDKFSRLHLVAAGQVDGGAAAILQSARLRVTLDALARTYDHVVIDGGALTENAINSLASFAPRAVLVARDLASAQAKTGAERLSAAGFGEVVLVQGQGELSELLGDAGPVAA